MIIHPNFDPVALRVGALSVHWYGLMYLAGFVAAGMLARLRASRARPSFLPGDVIDMVFFVALGAIIGGRFGYVLFYNLQYYLQSPLAVMAVWDGGMSFHGGLLGAALAIWWYAHRRGRHVFDVSDFIAPLCAPGLGFGRLGNFINQELWGRASDAPWAVWFHTAPGVARHPSQLYEFALEGVVLFILIWWYSRRPRARGSVTGMFLLWYAVFRFFAEFFREPDAHIGAVAFGWMSMGQALCLPMFAAGAIFLLLPHARAQKSG